MEKNTPLDSLREVFPDTAEVALTNIMVKEFFKVQLDGQSLDDLKWLFHYKHHVGQKGYLTYVDISDLSIGMHEVMVQGPSNIYNFPFATIPFYRDRTLEQAKVTVKNKSQEEEPSEDFQPKPFGIRK